MAFKMKGWSAFTKNDNKEKFLHKNATKSDIKELRKKAQDRTPDSGFSEKSKRKEGKSALIKTDPAEIARKKVIENVNEEIEYGTTRKKGPKRINPRSVAWKEARKKFVKNIFTGGK